MQGNPYHWGALAYISNTVGRTDKIRYARAEEDKVGIASGPMAHDVLDRLLILAWEVRANKNCELGAASGVKAGSRIHQQHVG